jgi:PAS domain S-box-containing protein
MLETFLDQNNIEHSTNCISGYDSQLNIIIWNKACEKKFSISKEDVIGKPLLTFFPFIVNDYRVQCFYKSLQEGTSFFFTNLDYHYSDGLYHQLILPLQNDQEEIVSVISIVKDIDQPQYHINKDDLLNSILYSPLHITK